MRKKFLPPICLLLAILLMVAMHLATPLATVIPPLWRLLGLIPLALGIVIEYLADRAFHLAHTTVKPFEEPGALITHGVYSFSRNPMYLGFALILAGSATIMGSLASFLIIPLFLAGINRWYIHSEEQVLEAKFGPAWLAYKASTRKWL